jgi:hypothetical protein
MDRKRMVMQAPMRKIVRFTGLMILILGLALCLFGVLALPDGGLLFALPYFFLVPGIVLTASGGFMVLLARLSGKTKDERSDVAKQFNSGECQ